MKPLLTLIFCLSFFLPKAQNLYFPPIGSSTWETIDPSVLGWCTDQEPQLYDFLDSTNTKAFIALKDGKIVLEHYFGTFTQDSLWYWASAGKTLTSLLTGIAQEEGYLDISHPSSEYQGQGWTACTPEQELAITVRHHLTMTTGLDDSGTNSDCTDPACLTYLADPGTRWSYHNAPYTQLDPIIEGATGQNFSTYFNSKIKNKIGMDGFWMYLGYNHIYFSTARSMARFGLCMLNNTVWQSDTLLHDQQYVSDMFHPSQSLNQSYGYLWWLSGQPTYMLPTSQWVFTGSLTPASPDDVYSAMGKNGQLIAVSPSTGLVWVRIGDVATDTGFVPNYYCNDIWEHLNALICTGVKEIDTQELSAYPNPTIGIVQLPWFTKRVDVYSITGQKVLSDYSTQSIDLTNLSAGAYSIKCTDYPERTFCIIKQ